MVFAIHWHMTSHRDRNTHIRDHALHHCIVALFQLIISREKMLFLSNQTTVWLHYTESFYQNGNYHITIKRAEQVFHHWSYILQFQYKMQKKQRELKHKIFSRSISFYSENPEPKSDFKTITMQRYSCICVLFIHLFIVNISSSSLPVLKIF